MFSAEQLFPVVEWNMVALLFQQKIEMMLLRVAALCALLLQLAESSYIASGYSSGREVEFYFLEANSMYNPAIAPGSMYVFRRSASLDSAPLPNQHDIIIDTSDVRQIVVVVVPEGMEPASEITTTYQLQNTSYLKVNLGSSKYCHCPLKPGDFSYRSDEDEEAYPTKTAWLANGTSVQYLLFGIGVPADPTPIYAVQTSDGIHLGYVMENVPGDLDYSPMRQLFQVTSATMVTAVENIGNVVRVDSGVYYSAPILLVHGPDAIPETFARQSGFYKGNVVEYYDFNGSRITTGMAQSGRLQYATMYFVQGQEIPVVDVVPGDADYSDLWAIVDVIPPENSTLPQTSFEAISSWAMEFRADYLNCPIVHQNATFLNLTNATMSILPLYYQSTLRYCANFSSVSGCLLQKVYSLHRIGESDPVEGNDLFTAAPSIFSDYTPLSWVLEFPVSQQYASGSVSSASDLFGTSSMDLSFGKFRNRPITFEAGVDNVRPLDYKRWLRNSHFDGLLLEWGVENAATLNVQLTAGFTSGYVAIGFGGEEAHDGTFVLGYIAADGSPCVRQFYGSSRIPGSMNELYDNVLNITSVVFSTTATSLVFRFSRNLNVAAVGLTGVSVDVTAPSRISFAVRRGALEKCATEISTLYHDAGAGEIRNFLWSTGEVVAPESNVTATSEDPLVSPTFTPQTTASYENYTGEGSYRLDASLTLSWKIYLENSEIEFLLTPTDTSKWIGIGLGSQMKGADITTVYRDPVTGVLYIDDRKGIGTELPPRDLQQDVKLVSTSEFRFRRKLDTGDYLTSAQPLARTMMYPEAIVHQSGWAHGVRVAFYDFGNGPTFGTRTTTATAEMYVMKNASGGSLLFQDDIVDVVPGQNGYSDLWLLTEVTVPSDFRGPTVRALQDIPTSWTRTPTTTRINCPITHSLTNIDAYKATSKALWYRGSKQKCVLFSEENANKTRPQKVYMLKKDSTNGTKETVETVFQYSPQDENFSAFVWVYHVNIPATYLVGNITSEEGVLTSTYPIEEQAVHRNYPFVSDNAIESPLPSETVKPVEVIDQSLLQQYGMEQVLFDDPKTQEVVLLKWNYLTATRRLQVLIIAYGISGYVAIGFSNATGTQMSHSDIVLGYVDSATLEPCIRTLHGEFPTSAPSATPTLVVRSAKIYQVSNAIALQFERDFDSNTHPEGLIPTPLQGGASRVLFATYRTPLSHNCSSLNYSPLYHGPSPHGSVVVDWAHGELTATPSTQTSFTASPVVLRPFSLKRQTFYFRDNPIPVYCIPPAPQWLPSSNETLELPTLYIVVDADSNCSTQPPIASVFFGATEYVGLWDVTYVVKPAENGTLKSVADFDQYNITTFSNGTIVNCPIVHHSTTLEPGDVNAFPRWDLYFNGESFGCFFLGELTENLMDTLWNVSGSTFVIDSLSPALRRVVQVTPSTDGTWTSAERLVGLSTVELTTVQNCGIVWADPALWGSVATPSAVTVSPKTGYFEGRTVLFLALQSERRFANEREMFSNPLYVLRRGTLLSSTSAQDEHIVDVSYGNITYSDIWRIVVVDVGTSTQHFASYDEISGYSMYPTNLYFNCPVIHSSTSFTGVTIGRQQLLYRGRSVICANFGILGFLPSTLSTSFELHTASGSIVEDNHIFSTAPGALSFFPVQWIKSARLLSDFTVNMRSAEALDATMHTETTLYKVWNLFIISVSSGVKRTVLSTMVSDGETLRRTGTAALMVSPPYYDLSTIPSDAPAIPALATIYFFRRGLYLWSEAVETQRPIVSAAPGQVSYTSTTGSEGYTDTMHIVVVEIPRNYSREEISTIEAIQSKGWAWKAIESTVAHVFLNVNTTSFIGEVSCPVIQVWAGETLYPSFDCGYSDEATVTTSEESVKLSTGLLASDVIGSSLATVVSLSPANPYIVNSVKRTLQKGWIDGRTRVSYYTLSYPSSIAIAGLSNVMVKYVFRSGPSIFSGGGVDILPALIDTPLDAGTFSSISELRVVDVRGSGNRSTDFVIVSKAQLLATAAAECWAIHRPALYEIGTVVLFQTTLDSIDGVFNETVYHSGTKYKHIVSKRLGLDEISSPNNFVVGIYSAGSFSHYVFSREAALSPSPWRLVLRRNVTDVALATSVLSDEGPNNATEAAVIHITDVSHFLSERYLPAENMTKKMGWAEGRRVFYYEFHRNVTAASVGTPATMYSFRTVNDAGYIIGPVGSPIIDKLPWQEGYNDLHSIYYVSVSSSYRDPLPKTVSALMSAVDGGKLGIPTPSGEIRNTPVVNINTVVETYDMFHPTTNPTGAEEYSVYCNGDAYAVLDFGAVSSSFKAADFVMYQLYRDVDGQRDILSTNSVLSSTPESPAYHPFCTVVTADVPAMYVDDKFTNVSDVTVGASNFTVLPYLVNAPMVRVDTTLASTFYDDTVIQPGAMKVIWATGNLQSYPLELLTHQQHGVVTIDFFTGETDEEMNGLALPVGPNTVQFGSAFTLHWFIRAASSQSRRFQVLREAATYAASELEIVFTFKVTLSLWAAIGLRTEAGGHAADVMMGYVGEYIPDGTAIAKEHTHLSDRAPSTNYTLPSLDAHNDLTHISSALDASGYTLQFSRKLVTGDAEDVAIEDRLIEVIWAYGPFDAANDAPLKHTVRGVHGINFVSGTVVEVSQKHISYWYLAIVIGLLLVALLLQLALRILPPGFMLYWRPFKGKLPDVFGWITVMCLGEVVLFVLFLVLASIWIVGRSKDFRDTRLSHPGARGLGAGSQFFMYLFLIPLFRNNPVLSLFRTSFNRTSKWSKLFTLLMLAFGWVHGVCMMIVKTSDAFKFSVGLTGLFGLILLTAFGVLHMVIRRFSPVLKQRLEAFLLLASFIFILVHQWRTVFGLIPTILLLLYDAIMRMRDFLTRTGCVRSYVAFKLITAIEMQVRSPWHAVGTRPFITNPGQFVLVSFDGKSTPCALMLSSRVVQEIDQDYATFTVHSKLTCRLSSVARHIHTLALDSKLGNHPVLIEGPYGGMRLRMKWYRSALCISGGIGMAGMMSFLEALVFQPDYFATQTSLVDVTVVWVVRNPDELLAFANELMEVLRQPRPFEFHVYLFSSQCKTAQVPPFVAEEDVEMAERAPRQSIPNHPLFREIPILGGRPDWIRFLTDRKLESAQRGEKRVAVYVSAPREMSLDVTEACEQLSTSSHQFHVEAETFRLD